MRPYALSHDFSLSNFEILETYFAPITLLER